MTLLIQHAECCVNVSGCDFSRTIVFKYCHFSSYKSKSHVSNWFTPNSSFLGLLRVLAGCACTMIG